MHRFTVLALITILAVSPGSGARAQTTTDCFADRVAAGEWQRVCDVMERSFADRRWREGAVAGIEALTALLVREFPAQGPNPNEQPNRPSIV